MNRINRSLAGAGAALALAAAPMVSADVTGRTALGGSFVSGGVGDGEIASLQAQRDRYSLWVITAAKGSGAYLADVNVRITDAGKKQVLEHAMAGPWLLVDLPPGRYEVEASFRGERHSRATRIEAGDRHQIVFYFDVPAETLPKQTTK